MSIEPTSASAQHLLANRTTGDLAAVDGAERDRLMATGEWLPICSEPEELSNYTRPKRLRRDWRLKLLLQGRSIEQINRIVGGVTQAPLPDRRAEDSETAVLPSATVYELADRIVHHVRWLEKRDACSRLRLINAMTDHAMEQERGKR